MVMTKKNGSSAALRESVRAAIKRDGLCKTAERIGVQPATLQRYAHNTGATHRGTVALIESAFS